MKKIVSPSTILLAACFGCACCASAQTVGPTATPSSLSFSYTAGSATLPASATVKITVPAALAGQPLSVKAPESWIVVTPSGGYAPLTLTVSFNPTGLGPGSQPPQTIFVDTATTPTGDPATITVYATILTPPPQLGVTSPENGSNGNYYSPGSGSTPNVVNFTYITGQSSAIPDSPYPIQVSWPNCAMELDVSSSGGIIPFNVTTATVKSTGSSGTTGSSAVWVRVNSAGQQPTSTTSNVANTGSDASICVTADSTTVQTLNPGSYTNQITIAGSNSTNGTYVALVNLTVAAGYPTLASISPWQIVAYPTVNVANQAMSLVFTLYGTNFFNTSVVVLLSPLTGKPISGVTTTLLSNTVLQATVPAVNFTPANEGSTYPVVWTVSVMNPSTPSNPSPQVAYIQPPANQLTVLDPSKPIIYQVVNAASYLSTSVFTGTGTNPNLPPTTKVGVPGNISSVAPREIISIFGQNLAPAEAVSQAVAVPGTSPAQYYYPYSLTYPTGSNVDPDNNVMVQVMFNFTPPALPYPYPANCFPASPPYPANSMSCYAPILMFTSNQINAIVPCEVAMLLPIANPTSPCEVSSGPGISNPAATVQVLVTTTVGGLVDYAQTDITPLSTVTVLLEDPGLFTFGGLGQGQAAVLNQDSSINGAKNAAARGSTVSLFVTGFGELSPQYGTNGTTETADIDGLVSTYANPVNDYTPRVDIDGQPSVVTYAGTAPGSVDGLVQINAIIPPTVSTGAAISVAASIGGPTASHRTQAGATISVK
jgi:uncharacterized protein (TIGR03437 family)